MRIPLVAALLAVACGPAVAATATNDTATVTTGYSTQIPVLTNDSGTTIAITKVTQPANGAVSVVGGRLSYKPTAGFTGTDTFTYTISDNHRQGRVVRTTPHLLERTNAGGEAVTAFNGGQGSALVPVTGSTSEFWMLTDRGPNADGAGDDKVFPVPTFQPKIVRVKRQPDGTYAVQQTIPLFAANGTTPISGLPGSGTAGQPGFNGDIPVAVGTPATTLAYDVNGMDPEGLAIDSTGNFWVADEYGPYITKFSAAGVELERIAPNANNTANRKLPQVLLKRFKNRGLEGLTITPSGKLVAIVQNAVRATGSSTISVARDTNVMARIVVVDPAIADDPLTLASNEAIAATKQYAYLMDTPALRISEITALSETKFLVLERDDTFLGNAGVVKKIWLIDITGASDLNDPADAANGKTYAPAVATSPVTTVTPEQVVQGKTYGDARSALLDINLVPVTKVRVAYDIAGSLGNGYPHDKIEGIAVLAKDSNNDPITIAIVNDDDFGLTNYSTLSANDISQKRNSANGNWADYTEILVTDLVPTAGTATATVTVTVTSAATSGNATAHLIPSASGVVIKPIFTAGQSTGGLRHDGMPYTMVGIPDGMGGFDNGDGTFTLLMNHELGTTSGVARAHGNIGAFVSRWVINKTSLAVTSIQDHNLTNDSIFLWDTGTSAYLAGGTTVYARFCAGDLAPASGLLNGAKGTTARVYMNGEETGAEGRVFGHVVTGTSKGKSWQLPRLGRASWENYLINPQAQDATIGIGTDDATPGQVYLYVGTKNTTGTGPTVLDDAGLTNGDLWAIQVGAHLTEDRAAPFGGIIKGGSTAFTCTSLGNVANTTGATINGLGGTTFLRPEDGAWNPAAPADFYFLTTDRQDEFKNGGSKAAPVNQGRSRLWRLRFSNVASPQSGGTITLLIDGSEDPGLQMMDNMCLDTNGRIIIQEDPGTFVFSANVWAYDIATGTVTKVATYDPTKFGDRVAGVDIPASTPFSIDEESSGVFDAKDILGDGWYVLNSQAHSSTGVDTETVEHGQLLAMYVPPGTALTSPAVAAASTDDDSGCGGGSGVGLLMGLGLLALGLVRQRLK